MLNRILSLIRNTYLDAVVVRSYRAFEFPVYDRELTEQEKTILNQGS